MEMTSIFEFTDNEVCQILTEHLIGKGDLPEGAYTMSAEAERNQILGSKGFRFRLKLNALSTPPKPTLTE